MVISVGNLEVGGTGKTPVTLWLADYFRRDGRRVAILSRGYGRRSQAVERVPVEPGSARLWSRYGDEPALMALKCRDVPVWVGRARALSGIRAVREDHAAILIMDDGFQHLALKRDLDLVLLDAARPFANGCLLPRGPLREPVSHLKRADALLIMHWSDLARADATKALLNAQFPNKGIFLCEKRITSFTVGLTGIDIPLRQVQRRSAVAFAGIARPESFFRQLSEMGIGIEQTLAFSDHHSYSPSDIGQILQAVKNCAPRFLITTEKDMVRLPQWLQRVTLGAVLKLTFSGGSSDFSRYLETRIEQRIASRPRLVRKSLGSETNEGR